MVANARSTIVLADHTKLGVVSRVSYCKPERIHILVTDARSEKSPLFRAIKEVVGAVCINGRLF
jgi:DeoR family transcriptional regulator, fructose operon transcriptional repressor